MGGGLRVSLPSHILLISCLKLVLNYCAKKKSIVEFDQSLLGWVRWAHAALNPFGLIQQSLSLQH